MSHVPIELPCPVVGASAKAGNGLSAFFRALGRREIQTSRHLWYEVGPRVFFAVPYHRPFSLETDEREELWQSGALWVRYFADPHAQGDRSYMFVLRSGGYDLSHLTSNTRSHTRRGMKKCTVAPVSFDYLLSNGLPLVSDTLVRQGRKYSKVIEQYWTRYFVHGTDCPNAEAWGAFCEKDLAAFVVAITFEDCVHIEMVFSKTNQLKHYPVNALIFAFSGEAIRRTGISCVSYGVRSIKGDVESLNKFKEGMGFERFSVAERLEVHPRLKKLHDLGLAQLIRIGSAMLRNRSDFWAKAHGMATLYLNQKGGGAIFCQERAQ